MTQICFCEKKLTLTLFYLKISNLRKKVKTNYFFHNVIHDTYIVFNQKVATNEVMAILQITILFTGHKATVASVFVNTSNFVANN